MDHSKLKKYAREARRGFMAAVEGRAAHCGLTAEAMQPVTIQGTTAMIDGRAFAADVAGKRRALEARITQQGFAAVVEAVAYTWFNRLAALRYMEIHGYIDHGYRVLSHPGGGQQPEILKRAEHVELPGVDRERVIELKLAGDKDAELYRLLLVGQCNALHAAMPFLFPPVGDETEMLLPDNLLHSSSLIRQMVEQIPEDSWQNIEIVGWLYQYYIGEKKDQVIGKVVRSEDIPAATQLFTPSWIVKYMVQNSLGAQWLATYPGSGLREQMEYYIEPAEQTDEVKAQLAAIAPDSLDPEALTLIDPACGSGHILVEAYELFKAIYLERGYRPRDIAQLILEKNLYGLDIDPRAAQLAGFALMMKGRADDRRLFARGVRLNVLAFVDSTALDTHGLSSCVNLAEYGLTADDLTALKQLFEHATTLGSLLEVPVDLAAKLPGLARLCDADSQDLFVLTAQAQLEPLVRQIAILAERYDAVVANPPYMGRKGMNAQLKKFAERHFNSSKADLFAVSTERFFRLANDSGTTSLMTPFTWMFLKSYEALRRLIIDKKRLRSLIQPEYHAFFESAYVPVCTFSVHSAHIADYNASFINLAEFYGADLQPRKALEAIENPECGWMHRAEPGTFNKIPGSPIVYTASGNLRAAFSNDSISDRLTAKHGLSTGNNDLFIRRWSEVSRASIHFACKSLEESRASPLHWYPCFKGGAYRKWYGNMEHVLRYYRAGSAMQSLADAGKLPGFRHDGKEYFFREAGTWSNISSHLLSMRYTTGSFVFDQKGSGLFADDSETLRVAILYFNSVVAQAFLALVCPTLDFSGGGISKIPFVAIDRAKVPIDSLFDRLIAIARADWSAYEHSWDFQSLALRPTDSETEPTVEASYATWIARNRETIAEMQRLEETNNRIFIDAYGLQDELTPEVPIEQITLIVNPAYRYGTKLTDDEQWRRFRIDTMKEIISYAIGCAMGRYSLDTPGLIYADGGNQGFDPDEYQTFPADSDGIIPITDTDWFDDDAANRVIEFIGTAWSADHLADNLAFVAGALGLKKSEQPADTIRRYLGRDFFKDHLKTYKKRPIYWLFSSGKQNAFACLVYLHRYHEGTLARMRTEYVIPLLGKLATRMEQIRADRDAATSTAHRRKLDKRVDQLVKQLDELRGFDEKLRSRADERIALDLDDGVKVNYGKFGDLLAKVKDVTGKKPAGAVVTGSR